MKVGGLNSAVVVNDLRGKNTRMKGGSARTSPAHAKHGSASKGSNNATRIKLILFARYVDQIKKFRMRNYWPGNG